MAVAKHTIEGDEVEWKAKIVEVADKRRVRRIKEALANPSKYTIENIMLNRDNGAELSYTSMWLDLVYYSGTCHPGRCRC